MDSTQTAQAVSAAEHLLELEQAIEVASRHTFMPAPATSALRAIFGLFHMLHGDVQQLKAQADRAPIPTTAPSSNDQAGQGNPAS